MGSALGALTLWLQPPPVLSIPSRTGPEGPPRPVGQAPKAGPIPAPTSSALARAQTRAMLDGPFPGGGLTRSISDGIVLAGSEALRAGAFSLIRGARAGVVRIPVNWRNVVSGSPPLGFQPRDPSDPAYDFTRIDAAVRGARAAGLQPLLVVSHAPAFAEAPHRWPYAYPGSWDPSPAALEDFAAALATRYDGRFPDPLQPGRLLPQVTLLQAWNEPNIARNLEPQWILAGEHWSAFSPLMYRAMLDAFYAGVKRVAPHDTVISAGLVPDGDRDGVGRMAPLRFLRALLCLADAGHRAGPCPERTDFDVLAFHPFSLGNPDRAAFSSTDVAISDAVKITGLLHAAERRRTVFPAGRKAVWVTEVNWESDPPVAGGVPEALQAGWLSRAFHRLWVTGVGLVSWEFLLDPYPGVQAATPTGGLIEYPHPVGLYGPAPGDDLALARPKPFLQGFELPFDPLRTDRRHVRVWALLAAGQPALLERLGASGSWVALSSLRADRRGIVNVRLALRGAMRLRLRAGALTSASATVGARGGAL